MNPILTRRDLTRAIRHALACLLTTLTLASPLAVKACDAPPIHDEPTRALFATPALDGWSVQRFDGDTIYTSEQGVAPEPQIQVHAFAHGTASGRILEIELNPQEWRCLTWSWRVGMPVAVENVRTRSGDDFAARVYVVFSGGWAPWRATSLVYVWGASDAPLDFWRNPYTAQARMMAATRGHDDEGWTVVKRDLVTDYRDAFNRDPPPIVAIAIMSDTDQTGTAVSASYGDLMIHRMPASTR